MDSRSPLHRGVTPIAWEEYVQNFIALDGRCVHGKFYFPFIANRPKWSPSTERLDSKISYNVKTNVSFCCEIFNVKGGFKDYKVDVFATHILDKSNGQ